MKDTSRIIAKYLAVNAILHAEDCCYVIRESEIIDMLDRIGITFCIDYDAIDEISDIYWNFGIDLGGFQFYEEDGSWVFDMNPGLDVLPNGIHNEFWDDDIRTTEEIYVNVCNNAINALAEIALFE